MKENSKEAEVQANNASASDELVSLSLKSGKESFKP